MTLPHLRRLVAAAALVMALLLAGCTQDEPIPKMPTPSAPSPTADPTETSPVQPTLPPDAEQPGKVGAEAFVRHYIATVDYARSSLQPELIGPLSLPTCAGCRGLARLLQTIKRNGGSVKGGDQTILKLESEQLGMPDGSKAYRAVVSVRTTAQTIQGSGVDALDGVRRPEELKYGFVLARNQSDWRTSEWDIL